MSGEIAEEAWPWRMKDLVAQTGLTRQTIHFYIQQGLLPPGQKTGRNTARYGDVHLERLQTIRQLQHERFLPLRAIKALFDEQEEQFTAPQRDLLRELRGRMSLGASPEAGGVSDDELPEGLSAQDLDELLALGLVRARQDGDRRLIAREDLPLLQLFAALRNAGLSRALGFVPEDLLVYREAMNALTQAEASLVLPRLAALPPDDAAATLDRALPLIHRLVARFHEARIRDLLTTS